MTIYLTRQLLAEFERRVQTILPATESIAKLDSDTIFSFLNQYLLKYIHEIYNKSDDLQSGTRVSARVERILQSMLKSQELSDGTTVDGNFIKYNLPADYSMYVRSASHVFKTYNWDGNGGTAVVANVLVNLQTALQVLEGPHDNLRILRLPLAVLSEKADEDNTLMIIHDRYTTISKINLLYYKQPLYFDVMTGVACELPMDCFDDLVTGAVELYIGYVRGGIRQQEEDGRRDRFDRRQAEREKERNEE